MESDHGLSVLGTGIDYTKVCFKVAVWAVAGREESLSMSSGAKPVG